MVPRQHQIEGAEWALNTIRKYGLAYLTWKERTGKTLTALMTVENSQAQTCLVVTKKKAIEGWQDTLSKWSHETSFEVINYESIHKCKGAYDFIVLDESHHAISSVGRPSETWKKVRLKTKNKAVLYLSATPYAEHLGLIYHQLKLSDWTPFKGYKNFYDWFRMYGISKMTRTSYGLVETYSKYKDALILKSIDHLFNFKTRAEVGIVHEPEARLVIVPMGAINKELIKQLTTDSVVELDDTQIICDTPMKERSVHYQIEGGTIKTESGYVRCGLDKIEYISDNYKDGSLAIMAHFIAEREILERVFPTVDILSSDGHAEGVDLSHIDKLIVYSMSFKTSKYTQRLARQANHNRSIPIVVDVLVSDKPGIGLDVYKTVALKEQNFNKNSYDRIR